MVYNKFGDHNPNGMIYVLKKDSARIRKKAMELFKQPVPQPYEEVRPLVIRANVGDIIQVNFENKLDRPASIHVQGMCYDVLTSDGSNVGYNPDSTARRFIRYTWHADKEGVFLFSDMGNTRSNEEGTNVHGLFGAIIVEAAGSEWFDPVTGKPLESGLFADIYNPAKPAFREYAVFFHDELEIRNKDGEQPIDPHTGLPNGTTAISYRSEPMRNRPPLAPHADTAEDISMSSWAYGDPCTPILETYPGEPIRIRLLDGAHEEQHIFNIEGMPWRKEITDVKSPLVQAQTIGISEAFNLHIDEPYPAGDYLYYSGGIDDLWLGLWGIIRAYATPQRHLLPLCGFKPICPPQIPPKGAVIRKFEVEAI